MLRSRRLFDRLSPTPAILVMTATALFAPTVFSAAARAELVAPTGWQREASWSTYFEWDVFKSATGDPRNSPDVGEFNPVDPAHGLPNVVEHSGTSFLTSGGNIYSFAAATELGVSIPNYALGDDFHTTIILQLRTQGSEADYSSFAIDTIGPVHTEELARGSAGGFGGDAVDWLARWELDGNAEQYAIGFRAAASSMSLDRLAVDTLVTLVGDVNGDGAVDIFDVAVVSGAWGAAGPTGDANYDGVVDIFDVAAISAKWGNTFPQSNAQSVPEPCGAALAALGVSGTLIVFGMRRRLDTRKETWA